MIYNLCTKIHKIKNRNVKFQFHLFDCLIFSSSDKSDQFRIRLKIGAIRFNYHFDSHLEIVVDEQMCFLIENR